MLSPISGARAIHSVIGAASSVTMTAAAATSNATRTTAVSPGDRPAARARFITGANVVPISIAAVTGSTIGRQK